MDKDTRNRIQRATQAARGLLEQDFDDQLAGVFDIRLDGTIAAAPGSHLDAAQRIVRTKLVAAVEHFRASGQGAAEAVASYRREAAFTTLNRFVALKMLEARGLVQECISRGEQSSGFKEFCGLAPGLVQLPDRGYRLYIESLFDELSVQIRVLFNRRDASSLLWPKRATSEALLAGLNAPELADVWRDDETIGWIYQYYNDEAERKRMREESSAPRNSRELAVRNQFFTPRYVVEFLTDNTLGRLWYEMTRGQTRLKEQCRYLVRRPTEIFLEPGESAPEGAAGSEAKASDTPSQEELLRQPVHIPHRPLKDPREIRLLDPACGSMHFGLYAFDLFEGIYAEAWDMSHGSDDRTKATEPFAPFVTFAAAFADQAAFLREIPRLIVEHNLHGIDIDRRAVQIAGLSLWLRAQRAWHQGGVKPADRPRITRSNVVCAEPMPGEKELLREFIEQQFPLGERPAFTFLLEKVFDRMALAGEAGSLLRIEEEIRGAIAEACALAQRQSAPRQFQLSLGDERPEQTELNLPGLNDEQFWQAAEQRIYDALKAYAEQAEDGSGFRRRLFADDAAQGFAFIDLCRKRYDVVLMNPPFGSEPRHLIDFIKKTYPDGRADLYACFLERAATLGIASVRIGILSSRTGFFLTTLESWRRSYLLGTYHLSEVADLGLGVLDDALVEAAAYVVSRSPDQYATFISCLADADKGVRLLSSISDRDFAEKTLSSMAELPLAPIAYWVCAAISDLFSTLAPLEGNYGYARVGLQTSDDFRFLRGFCEIPIAELRSDPTSSWPPMAKGGEYQLFYDDIHLVVNWNDSAREMKAFALGHAEKTGSARGNSPLREFYYYFKGGITYPERTTSEFGPRALPDGCITGTVGPGIHVTEEHKRYYLLGWLSTRVVRELIEVTIGLGDAVESGSAARHYNIRSIGRLPVPALQTDVESEIVRDIRDNVLRCLRMWERDEVSRVFLTPPLIRLDWKSSSRAWFDEQEVAKLLNVEGHARAENRFIESLSGAEEILKNVDKGVGMHPCALPMREVLDQDQVADAYRCGLDDLVNLVGREMRFSRQITKKSFLADRRMELIALWLNCHPRKVVELRKQSNVLPPGETEVFLAASFSHVFGAIFGRWDIRYATGKRASPELPDPFAPLPVCPPGMLQGDDGLPLSPEAGRRLRAEGLYPLEVAWDGILVDDPEHPLDIERRVHDALVVICGDQTDAIQQEACELLGVPTLRDWFRRPAGFFADHLKRYSKSRRQAPIYWPLSSPGGRYSLWLYYHRFSKDTLYRALEQVKEKLNYEERRLQRLTADAGNSPGAAERAARTDQESFVTELRSFQEELAQVAPLWSPNLNDGVILNYGPLWRMIGHIPWQKAVKEKWDALVAGKYDWAHLAMHLWPERVVPQCAKDRSLAIAHGLEAVFWEEGDKGKWVARTVAHAEVDRLIAERTSAAVKDALKSLLDAPAPVTGRGGGRKSSGRVPVRRAPTVPRSDNAGAGSRSATGSVAPDPAILDAVKQAIAAAAGGTSKSGVLAATGLSDAQWNIAINALLAEGRVTKTGAARGTRYQLSAPD